MEQNAPRLVGTPTVGGAIQTQARLTLARQVHAPAKAAFAIEELNGVLALVLLCGLGDL